MLSHMLRATIQQQPPYVVGNLTFIDKTVININGNLSSTVSINTPRGTQSGDIILAVSTSVNRSNGHTATGFTQWFFCGASSGAGGIPKTTVLYNILTAAPAASYSFTITNGYGTNVYLALFTYRPNSGVVTVGNFARNITTPTSSTTAIAPDVSGTSGQALFRLYGTPNSLVWSAIPTDYITVSRTQTGNSLLLINKTATVTGAQGTQSVTVTPTDITNVASFFINAA
jgi:hypothetical protein